VRALSLLMNQTTTPPSQIQALELLFNSTQGDQWIWRNEATNGPKWSFSFPQPDPCNDQNRVWQGITCSSSPNMCKFQSCEVVSLVLESYNLKGTLPPGFFVPLISLTNLDVSSSLGLVGSIPAEIGSLSQLRSLSLSINQLTGVIPSEIGSLSQLSSMYLQDNQLTGVIPPEIRSLSHLDLLSLSINQLTGTIPSEIGSLSHLNSLSLSINQLTGTIPSEIGSLSQLRSLSLSINQLTGTIPSEIRSLSHLGSLYLYNNQLTGTIHSEIGSFSEFRLLDLSINQLTGTIPFQIGSLSQLGLLDLSINQLTGTIPFLIGSLSQLSSLSLSINQLTGTFPSEIGSLSHLGSLYLYNNQLTGTIPSQIAFLSQLNSFYLDKNQLTGTIPSEIGSLSQLSSLYLSNNQLTGTIPPSLSNLLNLVWLHLYDNHLNGQITSPLASLPQLRQLFLHRNHFTGHLDALVFFSPWNSSSSKLLNLDVSDNLFSGSVPSALFLPHLESISLSLNCFEHKLSSSICEARDARVISMDGLGSAKGCKNVVTVPFTYVTLVRSLGGNIPDCVWSMSNLKMLNLAGNGLKGRISSASSMSSLLSLTLSHNYLSGEIPLWLQKMNLSHLDLSHNKLTGDAAGFRHQDDISWTSGIVNTSPWSRSLMSRNLSLAVNRLSGDLPDSFGKYENLDILSGNLFGCANLAKNDENSDFVSCGSQDYDQTMVLMGGVLGSIMCSVMMFYLLSRLLPSFRSQEEESDNDRHGEDDPLKSLMNPEIFIRYLRYHLIPSSKGEINSTPSSSLLRSTNSFGSLLSRLMRSVCMLAILCLLLSFPIYVLKQLDVGSGDEGDPQYVTHSHMYNWLWTMAFLSGTTPAMILFLMCFVCLLYFAFVMNRLGAAIDVKEEPPTPLSTSTSSKGVWITFVLNVVVVGTINGLYLWSTLLDLASDVRIWIQFCFGLFSFLWNVALRSTLPFQITESKAGVWLFTCLNVMNSVILPCLATALSSPSCYQVS
jgi:Leucine-rich repeat (LRR) protein